METSKVANIREGDNGTVTHSIGRAQVLDTFGKIRNYIRRTPILEVNPLDFGLGEAGDFPITFKLEFLQHAGSFKSRGAFANLLTRDVPPEGIVAASGGNHGAAVAYAARTLGVPANIFIPSIASPAKVEQIKRDGATLHIVGERYQDALAASEAWCAKTGALAIHAFDQEETLAGQGTVALEFAEQAPLVDTVLVSVGGGGLIGGMAAYYQGAPRLIGVEPKAAPTLHNAFLAGGPVDAPAGGIAADSLAPKRIGSKVYPLASAFVERSILISDESIILAQEILWKTLRIVTEPGGATAFGALISGAYKPGKGERIGVLLCGANSHAVRFGAN